MGNNASQANSSAIGVLVGFGILLVLFGIGFAQFCCKYKCKDFKKCFKKKKPPLKDRVLTKMGVKKSSPPFSISSYVKQ